MAYSPRLLGVYRSVYESKWISQSQIKERGVDDDTFVDPPLEEVGIRKVRYVRIEPLEPDEIGEPDFADDDTFVDPPLEEVGIRKVRYVRIEPLEPDEIGEEDE